MKDVLYQSVMYWTVESTAQVVSPEFVSVSTVMMENYVNTIFVIDLCVLTMPLAITVNMRRNSILMFHGELVKTVYGL